MENKDVQLDANILIGEYQKEVMKLQSELITLRALIAQNAKQGANPESQPE